MKIGKWNFDWKKWANNNWTIGLGTGLFVTLFTYFFLTPHNLSTPPVVTPVIPNPIPTVEKQDNVLYETQTFNYGTAGDCTDSTTLITGQHVRTTATRASGESDNPLSCGTQSFIDYKISVSELSPGEKVRYKISTAIDQSEAVYGGVEIVQIEPIRQHVYQFEKSETKVFELINKNTYRFQIVTAMRPVKGINNSSTSLEIDRITE